MIVDGLPLSPCIFFNLLCGGASFDSCITHGVIKVPSFCYFSLIPKLHLLKNCRAVSQPSVSLCIFMFFSSLHYLNVSSTVGFAKKKDIIQS